MIACYEDEAATAGEPTAAVVDEKAQPFSAGRLNRLGDEFGHQPCPPGSLTEGDGCPRGECRDRGQSDASERGPLLEDECDGHTPSLHRRTVGPYVVRSKA